MRVIADLHIHSKYSRATSPTMDLEYLNWWGQIKGITVLGTGDFTHPLWFKELKEKLESAEAGLFVIKDKYLGVDNDFSWHTNRRPDKLRFMLTAEISCIYSKNNRTRKVHILIFAPDFQTVEKINARLNRIGNLKSDGRPIIGMDAKELAKIVLEANLQCLIVPAHVWTPWFSIFGSKSGFDSIEECFDEYSKYIYAVETGLSSDPSMNWRLSQLDKVVLLSNSDCHSPSKIGREANVFEIEENNLSYNEIARIIKEKDKNKFLYTVEFFPEEGKYHHDGHRKCSISFSPAETIKHKGLCPVCHKPLTKGVMYRVDELADRPIDFRSDKFIPFKSLIPLEEIIADVLGVGVGTKTVNQYYRNLINSLDSEFNILLDSSVDDIRRVSTADISLGIESVRSGQVKIEPGYDGEYGRIKILSNIKKTRRGQIDLF